MMYIFSTLLLAMAAQPADHPDIVVIGKRLDNVSVHVTRSPDGKWHCSMDGSSGVMSLDRKVCKAVTKCVRKGAQENVEVKSCVNKSKKNLLAKFKREMKNRR